MASGQLEMHVRVKRKKTVLFLLVDPSETVRDVKRKIEELLQQPVEKQRLYKEGVQLGGESATLANLKIEADDELVLTFPQNGGDWEDCTNIVESFQHQGEGGAGMP